MSDRTCWTCAWVQLGGDSFLGLCKWFETRGGPKKPIPPHIVDTGWQGRGRP